MCPCFNLCEKITISDNILFKKVLGVTILWIKTEKYMKKLYAY